MSYQVLARKWRPRSFPEMAGQEHVLRALIHALDEDRLHHAFLFTGTRGVGKTTVARILAKSLNCEKGVSSTPCGECAACREIDEGRFVDLIEVDAASRTKVEDTRELLENVQYTPTRGRYKVYLIDEVHMLSNHSFNALLKTLEEPPPHVKFLLATTDPQKLPVTILSRCLQFNLKRLPLELIDSHLMKILGEEGIEAEPAALLEIARAADGSMRDALSLLDQAIAYGGGALKAEEVRAMLGSIDRQRVFALLEALAEDDAAALFAEVAALAEQGPDFAGVLNEMNGALQRIALAQRLPEAVDDSLGEAEAIRALATRMPAEDVQLYYQIGITGRRDLPLAPEPRGGFEMTLLRMLAFQPDEGGSGGGGGSRPAVQAQPRAEAKPESKPEPRPEVAAPPAPVPAPVSAPVVEAAAEPAPPAQPEVAEVREEAPRRPSRLDEARAVLNGEMKAPPPPAPRAVTPEEAAARSVRSDMPPQGFDEAPPMEGPPPGFDEQGGPPPFDGPSPTELHGGDGGDRALESMPPAAIITTELPEIHVSEQAEAWAQLLEALPELGGVSKQFAKHCALLRREGNCFELALDANMPEQMGGRQREQELQQALSAHLGEAVELQFREASGVERGEATPNRRDELRRAEAQRGAEQAIADDPAAQALLRRFGAQLVPGSVRPL